MKYIFAKYFSYDTMMKGKICLHSKKASPGRSDQSCQNETFVFSAELHNPRGFKLPSDPVSLVQVVDEHKLHTNVTTISLLK